MSTRIPTYIYSHEQIPIRGFIASLLLQGEDWDIRCAESDAYDYHQQYYSRMDAKSALEQEVEYWWKLYSNEHLTNIPRRDDLLAEGLYYILWQAQEVLLPIEETDKLTTNMVINLSKDHYLYKVNNVLALFPKEGEPDLTFMLNGFAAQLLSYAACCSMEEILNNPKQYDPILMVKMISDWLQSTPTIWLEDIKMDIADVYQLYASYVEEEKAKWDAENKRRYQSEKPQVRYFMTHLLEQVQQDSQEAISLLTPHLSTKQLVAYERYLAECQQYIIDHTQTRRKEHDESFDQFFYEGVTDYYKQKALERIQKAVHEDNPAAMLAIEVKKLRNEKILIPNFHSYKRFADIVNSMFNVAIKADSLSKHFRRKPTSNPSLNGRG